MPYHLRPGLAFVTLPRWTVFLDILGNRYFCVDSGAGEALVKLADNAALSDADHRMLEPLVHKGMLVMGTDCAPFRQMAAIESRSSVLDGHRSFRWSFGANLTFLVEMIRARIALRKRPLNAILSDLVRWKDARRGTSAATGDEVAERLSASAQAVSALFGKHDQCLPQSLALTQALARRGVASNLVFGVSMDPFAAHCWVQRGGIVLNDRIDHIRTFTPILVL